jgi:hypothetical protein
MPGSSSTRRAGAASGRGDRRRGRLLPPDLWRPVGPLPRGAVGTDLGRGDVDLRRQARVTRRIVEAPGVRVPAQLEAEDDAEPARRLPRRARPVVVKPARGEQGAASPSGLTTPRRSRRREARALCDDVVVEECFEGEDLRLVVIDYRVVAAAIRRPARIVVGDGRATVRDLIEAQSRRRAAATGGRKPHPARRRDRALPGRRRLRSTTCPTGGARSWCARPPTCTPAAPSTTSPTRPIPADRGRHRRRPRHRDPGHRHRPDGEVPREPDYVFIEANERPGLANHEPQPTAERFVDLLFPLSMPRCAKRCRGAARMAA